VLWELSSSLEQDHQGTSLILKKITNFLTYKKQVLNCMFGLPDITVISMGVVVGFIILALLYWGLKFNPESDA